LRERLILQLFQKMFRELPELPVYSGYDARRIPLLITEVQVW
jgi:hypothetical protein